MYFCLLQCSDKKLKKFSNKYEKFQKLHAKKKFHFFPPTFALACSLAAKFIGNTRRSPGFGITDGTVSRGGIVIGWIVYQVGLMVGREQPGIAENSKIDF